MKKVSVEICVCTQCLMNGAMDIMQAIEEMQKLKSQLKISAHIEITTNKCIGSGKHPDKSPIVIVNGEVIDCADSQMVMSRILQMKAC